MGEEGKGDQQIPEIFCSEHSKTTLEKLDAPVSEGGQLSKEGIKELFGMYGLRPLENMRNVGSVCLKDRAGHLNSCLLFVRDDEASLSTIVFDIARFTVGHDTERRNQAASSICLDAFKTLLRHSFPSKTIILRASVVEEAQNFFERAGFQRGFPRGRSGSSYCGHSLHKTYHLILPGNHATPATKKRKLTQEPVRQKRTRPFRVEGRVVWKSRGWKKKKKEDFVLGCVKEVNRYHDSKYRRYQYFVKWDNETTDWVDHEDLLSRDEMERHTLI